MKRIYDFSRKPAKRNYTISDLQELKNKAKKLTMSNPAASAHYGAIASRSVEYLNDQLNTKKYLCGDVYTIADIALFPWLRIHKHLGLSLENAENLSRWHEAILARPATEEALTFFDGISS